MAKKLSKILWYGADKDASGKPIIPPLSPSIEKHLEGLNEGEIYIHNDDEYPALYIRTNKDKIVAIGGVEALMKFFLRKDQPDTAREVITFEKGLESKGDVFIKTDVSIGGKVKETLNVEEDVFIGKNIEVAHNADVNGELNVGSNTNIAGQTIMEQKSVAKGGIQIGDTFIPGILTGTGGFFDSKGNGEVESLVIRRFLEVPELRFNRVEVKLGDKWNAPGGGIFEDLIPDYDEDGNLLMTGTGYLKLEEGEYGAIAVGDICMGIFHSEDSNMNATEDYDNSKGIFQFAGFYTCYFTITEITGNNNKEFRYSLRPISDDWGLTYHPSIAMNFVTYGSFTRSDRQTSLYQTRTYTRLLKSQNTWEIKSSNIAMQYGVLTNMSIHGLDMTGYSVYLNNIYMTGSIKQVKPDGTPLMTANERGAWKSGETYAYYDRVSHNGGLWLCISENGTTTEPTEGDPLWLLEVQSGTSITSHGSWNTKNTPYKVNSIVTFAQKVWISNKETSGAPYPLYTDNNGNRLLFNDGGYIISSLEQSADWDLLLDAPDLTNGQDGKSLYVRYSSDKVSWHDVFVEGDEWMQQRVGEDAAWSDAIRITGEEGAAGKDGTYYDYQFAVNDSIDISPTTGWQDTPPKVNSGQYLWMRTRFVDPNSEEENPWAVARIGGEKGEKGDSITNMGKWETGMAVPALGVVVMGGKTYMAKVATNNPPLWCYTDNEGNRLLFNDGGYILTGEENSDEYTLMVESGKDGSDGKDYEYIYIHTTENIRPSTPVGTQTDDYVPSGWHDNPIGTSEELPFEWVSLRTKKDGMWSAFSTPAIWSKWGFDGENAILADIDNEMDNVALDSEGKTTSATEIEITASMFYGSSKQALTAIVVSSVANITSSYVLNTGVITLKIAKGVSIAERNEISITLKANINGKEEERTVKFTLAGVRAGADGQSAVLYDIVLSASSIVLKKDGSYSVETISATRNKTVGSSTTETTEGTLKYSIDGGTETTIANNTPIPVENIKTNIKFMLYNSNGTLLDKETVPLVMDGVDGDGFTMMGNYKTGMAVPKMGIVTMGGSAFAAKVETTNPPMWVFTDNSGNRLTYSDGGYVLTGEINTDEYDLWVESGKDGKDGVNGADGKDGEKGDKGDTGLPGAKGLPGQQGCILRYAEWAIGVEWRNDEGVTENVTRYLDCALVRNVANKTGWDAYKCIKTHVSTEDTSPTGANAADYWESFGLNVPAVFTNVILAKNAHIDLLQGNDILVKKSDGTVTAGISGNEDDNVRFWAGATAENRTTAPFFVDVEGAGQLANGRQVWTKDGVLRFISMYEEDESDESIYKSLYTEISNDGLFVYYADTSVTRYNTYTTQIRGNEIIISYYGGASVLDATGLHIGGLYGSYDTEILRGSVDTNVYYAQGIAGISGEYTVGDTKITVTGGIITNIEKL